MPAEKIIYQEFKCGICLDLVHECVSLNPCLHIFCGGCCSDWFKTKINCPLCTETVIEVKLNHNIRNFVEKYAENNPDANGVKTQEEMQYLTKKNIFTSNEPTSLAELLKIHPSKCIECFLKRPSDGFLCETYQQHEVCSHCNLNFP